MTYQAGANYGRNLVVEKTVDGVSASSGEVGEIRNFDGETYEDTEYLISETTGIDASLLFDFRGAEPGASLREASLGTIQPEPDGVLVKTGTTEEVYGDTTVTLDVYEVDLSFFLNEQTAVRVTGEILVFPEDVTIPGNETCVE